MKGMHMLKKTTRLALSLAIAAPLFILPQVYAAQLPETTVIATEQVLDNTPQAFTPQLMSININTPYFSSTSLFLYYTI